MSAQQLAKFFLSSSILSSYLWIAQIILHHSDYSFTMVYMSQRGYIGWNGWNFMVYALEAVL